MKNLFKFLHQEESNERSVLIVAAIFFCFVLFFSLLRHYSFFTSYDQGIFNQVFWNNLHGRFFQSSLSSALSTNVIHNGEPPAVFYHRLGQHFTPALLLWLPIYALFPSPATLLVIQVTLIALGGLVLYILARHYLQPRLAIAIAASYYSGNAVLGPAFSNFSDLCQIPLFIFGLLLALEKRIWWLFWLLAVLTLAIREDSGVVLFGVGVYLVLSRRYPQIGLALCSLSFGYMLLVTNVVMAMFSEDVSRRFMIEHFGQYATSDSASTLEIIWGMISQPHRVIIELINPVGKTLNYLAGQWLPLAFVPAISPAAWAISGFPLLQVMLQKGSASLRLNWRYALTIVPGLFYGVILWWSVRSHKFTPRFHRFWMGCMAIALAFTFASSPHQVFYFIIPDSLEPLAYSSVTQRWNHVRNIRAVMAQIPRDASVSATTYMIPHLSGRREVLRLPAIQLQGDSKTVVSVQYAIADFQHFEQYLPAFKFFRQQMQDTITVIDQVVSQELYGIVDVRDGVVLLQKGVSSQPQAAVEWEKLRDRLSSVVSSIHTASSLRSVAVRTICGGAGACDRIARNIPNRQRPVPKANRISRRVGTSRKDLIKPEKPKRTSPCGRATPCQIESNQDGRVCSVQSAVITSPSVNPVAAKSSEKPSILENAG